MEDGKMTVRAVERALDILLVFTEHTSLGLTEIAEQVGLHKSTVHRLLASLEGKGFLVRDAATEKYRLGFRVWELSAQLSGQSDDLGTLLQPELERLRDLVGETISLYIREGNERIRIQAVQSRQAIRRVAPVGARLPLYVGASSKVLLAFADESVRDNLMNGPDWPGSIDRAAFLRRLEDIRSLGYATSVEEREPGAAAVAAPIFAGAGRLAAALAVSGPSNRLDPEKMREIAPQVIEAARRMGKMMK
ncbi:IclR family transcriptional regulator [Paenibacillus antri]|uniref:Glycerol operon regulatory protein n=1 Tax=Paenibacillus antri TaxID=2582848 RepID=A0A5R9G4B5_9BACL|nr:IclR family transcriptional regulator [Paenibacillus antri]TLS48970.1 IclR family transcriptional regulator [Paenibacillus antri]